MPFATHRPLLPPASYRRRASRSSHGLLAGAAAALAAAALANHLVARRSERRHPPRGRFLEVEGLKLHYMDEGPTEQGGAQDGGGMPIVLLHGNGAMAEDFVASGLLHRLARHHRVIAFDRPGFGHTPRPRGTIWSARAQAALFQKALRQLDVRRPVVVGHSWATLVALTLALDHPRDVGALVLLSGYYHPTARLDLPAMSIPAVPLLGDIMRYTFLPLLTWLMLPRLVRWLFAPSPVTRRFRQRFPAALSLRPSQLRASASDTALMIPGTAAICRRYGELAMPVVIVSGTQDHVVDFVEQATWLHDAIDHSRLHAIAADGHMIHYTAPEQVEAAIAEAVAAAVRERAMSAA